MKTSPLDSRRDPTGGEWVHWMHPALASPCRMFLMLEGHQCHPAYGRGAAWGHLDGELARREFELPRARGRWSRSGREQMERLDRQDVPKPFAGELGQIPRASDRKQWSFRRRHPSPHR